MGEFLDADELPFTFAELTAALLVTCRFESDACESAEEYRRIAADRRRERRADPDVAPDPTLLPLDVLAALALGSPDAAVRAARVRHARLPAGASAAFRAEEDTFWAETLEKVRGWAARRGGSASDSAT